MAHAEQHKRIRDSWIQNADAWTEAVRQQRIPSRRAGTDAAILNACRQLAPRSLLDVGCGEGWLVRALAESVPAVVGIDASEPLIASARTADERAQYHVVDFEALSANPQLLPAPWEAIVCNFVLVGDPIAPLLAALAHRLAEQGTLLIQTVHPRVACGDAPYRNGWREETFASFGAAFKSPMPWYFRTLESWVHEIEQAGLTIVSTAEPLNAETGQPLSLLFECRR